MCVRDGGFVNGCMLLYTQHTSWTSPWSNKSLHDKSIRLEIFIRLRFFILFFYFLLFIFYLYWLWYPKIFIFLTFLGWMFFSNFYFFIFFPDSRSAFTILYIPWMRTRKFRKFLTVMRYKSLLNVSFQYQLRFFFLIFYSSVYCLFIHLNINFNLKLLHQNKFK